MGFCWVITVYYMLFQVRQTCIESSIPFIDNFIDSNHQKIVTARSVVCDVLFQHSNWLSKMVFPWKTTFLLSSFLSFQNVIISCSCSIILDWLGNLQDVESWDFAPIVKLYLHSTRIWWKVRELSLFFLYQTKLMPAKSRRTCRARTNASVTEDSERNAVGKVS